MSIFEWQIVDGKIAKCHFGPLFYYDGNYTEQNQ